MLQVIDQEFTVRYSFPILFTRSAFHDSNPLLAELFGKAENKRHRVLVFIDSGVTNKIPQLTERIEQYARVHEHVMDLVTSPLIIPGGEECKNRPAVLDLIHTKIENNHLCRQSFVMAIGGGAVLDAVGYGAATAHRGIRLIRMPTTVLAQNDAGVGVKNGINGYGRKNFLGTFAPPFAVINDFDFLNSLSARNLRAGIIEAVKVALIKDQDFFNVLFENRQQLAAFAPSVMEGMIFRCAALHSEHIGTEGDPFETGSSRPLDFGHWSAHKLEELTENRLNHGEAVAIGLALDSLYSYHKGFITNTEVDRIVTLLDDLHLTLFHPTLYDIDIHGALGEFQEHLGGNLTITLPAGIGNRTEVHEIDVDLMGRCMHLLEKHWKRQLEYRKGRATTASTPLGLTTDVGEGPPLPARPVLSGTGPR